jgi:competence protein ComEC
MPWIAAALVLILVQHGAGCGVPRTPEPLGDAAPPHVVELLEGRTSTPDHVELTGRVTDAAPTWGSGVRLTVEVELADGKPVQGLVSVSLRETSRRWRTGDRLASRSRLRRITGFGNFGELDWAAYNARRGVFVSASVWDEAKDVRVLPSADGVVDSLRRRFSAACEAAGGQGAEILEALTIGDRTGLTRETSDAVRDAGLAHFLAISGSHMALLVALVVGLVKAGTRLTPALLERYDVLRGAAILAAVAVVAYGAVSGGGVSVARSVLMALAAMAALWRGLPGDDLRALGGSAIVLALAMPGVGGEAGFQLSYLAVAALIADARRKRAKARAERAAAGLARATAGLALATGSPTSRPAGPGAASPETAPMPLRRALHLLLEAVRLTLVCWLVTSPIVAHHFQRISLVSPLANLLAAPLVSAIVVTGIGGLVVLPASPGGGALLVRFGAWLADVVLAISDWCASLPMAATATPAPSLPLTAALTSLGLVLLTPPSRWRRRLAAGLAVASALGLAGAAHDRWRTDRLDVWFASVGQGDAAIVREPGGKVWVIDQGSPGRGRMVVGPLLRRAWIGRVDVLVASHVQSDHSGALAEILEEFDVGEVWLPDGPCENEVARRILDAAAGRGVPVRFVSSATAVRSATAASGSAAVRDGAPRATVRILSPHAREAACNDNDGSLVLGFAFAGRRVLFTGDIESRAESALATSGAVRADVLKVPHHGSRTSSTAAFLDAVRPSLAIASLGLDNQWRFPAPDVVARYDERDVRFLRTDRDGAVHLVIADDGRLAFETYRQAPP